MVSEEIKKIVQDIDLRISSLEQNIKTLHESEAEIGLEMQGLRHKLDQLKYAVKIEQQPKV